MTLCHRRRAGVLHYMPDELSRLPYSRVPDADTNDAFPDELSTRNPGECAGPRGGTLNGIVLTDLTPISADEQGNGGAELGPASGHRQGTGSAGHWDGGGNRSPETEGAPCLCCRGGHEPRCLKAPVDSTEVTLRAHTAERRTRAPRARFGPW